MKKVIFVCDKCGKEVQPGDEVIVVRSGDSSVEFDAHLSEVKEDGIISLIKRYSNAHKPIWLNIVTIEQQEARK